MEELSEERGDLLLTLTPDQSIPGVSPSNLGYVSDGRRQVCESASRY